MSVLNKDATVVALVPMKHTSVRVRGKNYRSFQGQPLCYWVLNALCKCPRITQVVVDTDSPLLIEMLSKDFPEIKVINRPEELLNDPPMNEILLHDTSPFALNFQCMQSYFACQCSLAACAHSSAHAQSESNRVSSASMFRSCRCRHIFVIPLSLTLMVMSRCGPGGLLSADSCH